MLRHLFLLVAATVVLPGYSLIYIGDDANTPNLHWSRGVVVPIHIDTRGYDGLAFATVRGALENGLARWHTDNTSLRFGRDPNGRNGDSPAMDGVNLVRFENGPLPPEVDPNHTLAFTAPVSVACTGVYLEGDITFNAGEFSWSTNPGRGQYDLESVMTHEAGHLAGLGHTDVEAGIMFPSIGPRTVKRAPQADDLRGLEAVYGLQLGGTCSRDGDCAGGEACLYSVRSDESFGAFCGPPLGARQPGAACVADAGPCENGCNSGLCVGDGVCSAVCETDRDCPGDLACIPQPTDGGDPLGLCLDVRLCEGDLDACNPGQACGFSPHPTDPGLLYLCVSTGDRATGDACADGSQCQRGVCVDATCTGVCDSDRDCPGAYPCAARQIPLPGGGTARAQLCTLSETGCARPNDCLAGSECGYLLVDERARALCLPSDGAAAGAACRREGDCRANLCLSESGQCSDVCFQDRDCPAGWRCGRAAFRGTQVPACVPDAVEPPPDLGAPDAAVARDAEPVADARPRDAQVAPTDAGVVPIPDGGPGRADAAPPIVVVGADERRGGGGASPGVFGCVQSGDAPAAWWVLGALALGLRRRRR